jgi:hypothetical protein
MMPIDVRKLEARWRFRRLRSDPPTTGKPRLTSPHAGDEISGRHREAEPQPE